VCSSKWCVCWMVSTSSTYTSGLVGLVLKNKETTRNHHCMVACNRQRSVGPRGGGSGAATPRVRPHLGSRPPLCGRFLGGPWCNTLVLSLHFAFAFAWEKTSSIYSWAWAYEISSHSLYVSHVMLIIYMHMLVIMCDQYKRWLWGHKSTLDISRMVNGTMFVFMTWANFASKS